MRRESEVIRKSKKAYEEVKGRSEKVKPLHKTEERVKKNKKDNKKWGDITSNEDKYNDNVTEVTEK